MRKFKLLTVVSALVLCLGLMMTPVKAAEYLDLKPKISTKNTAAIAIKNIHIIVVILGTAIKLFNLCANSIPHLPSDNSQSPALEYCIEFQIPSWLITVSVIIVM